MNTISVLLLKQGQPHDSDAAGRRPFPTRFAWPLALLLAAAYLFLVIRHVDACAGGADSSGYMNHALVLGSGRHHVPSRSIPGAGRPTGYTYCPLGFRPSTGGTLVPTYPVGTSLFILAAKEAVGWTHAFDLVIVLHAAAGLLLVFLLGRRLGFDAAWSGAAVAVTAASPLYLAYALQGMSDLPAMVWCAALALLVWHARGRPGWAIAAGAAFSVAVLIRPTDALMLVPVAAAWWPAPGEGFGVRAGARRALLFVLGGLPGAAFFCFDNLRSYGAALTTGYGDIASLFQAGVARETLAHYAHWLPVLFTPVVWLCVALPFAAARSRIAAFLLSWIAAFLGFYLCYSPTHETWWYLRFVLPAAPALVFGGLWMLRAAFARIRPRRAAAAAFAVLLLAALAEQARWCRKLDVLQTGIAEDVYPRTMAWIGEHAPARSILIAMQTSGAAFFYTRDTVVRWDQLKPPDFRRIVVQASKQGRPIYAPLFPWEKASALGRRMPGRWIAAARVGVVTIWRWAGAEPARTS
ncbi:MAG: ArnT family glycosyltransferase [Opitutaceae bacterium]